MRCGSDGKQSTCNAEGLGSIPGWGRSPGEGNDYPLQYSSLKNSMDIIVRGVARSRTPLSDFHLDDMEKEIAILSSILAWEIL